LLRWNDFVIKTKLPLGLYIGCMFLKFLVFEAAIYANKDVGLYIRWRDITESIPGPSATRSEWVSFGLKMVCLVQSLDIIIHHDFWPRWSGTPTPRQSHFFFLGFRQFPWPGQTGACGARTRHSLSGYATAGQLLGQLSLASLRGRLIEYQLRLGARAGLSPLPGGR